MLYWWPKDCIDMMVITRIWFDRKNNLSLNFPDFFLRLIILFSKIFYWTCFLHNRFSCVVGIFHFWERNNGEKCKNFLCCLVLQFYRGIYGSVLQGDIWISWAFWVSVLGTYSGVCPGVVNFFLSKVAQHSFYPKIPWKP